MKLSPAAGGIIEDFFRQYFADPDFVLPEVEVHSGKFSAVLTAALRVDGITIGRHVLIRPGLVYQMPLDGFGLPKHLLVHEIAHVIQYRNQRFSGFLLSYFKEYFVNLRKAKDFGSNARLHAYQNIPHEIEARKTTVDFLQWYSAKF